MLGISSRAGNGRSYFSTIGRIISATCEPSVSPRSCFDRREGGTYVLVDENDRNVGSVHELGKGSLDGRYRCLCAARQPRPTHRASFSALPRRRQRQHDRRRTRVDHQKVLLALGVDVPRAREEDPRDRVLAGSAPSKGRPRGSNAPRLRSTRSGTAPCTEMPTTWPEERCKTLRSNLGDATFESHPRARSSIELVLSRRRWKI